MNPRARPLADPVSRPLIAIDGELLGEQASTVSLAVRYARAIERAGGLPFVLPPLGADALQSALEAVDAVLFAGGDDFDTERLALGPTHPRAKPVPAAKQDFDVALARATIERGLPVLGICYGMQLLALAAGGDLHQHLPDDRPGSQDHTGGRQHPVQVRPGTKLAECLGVTTMTVISRHHQALSRPGDRWLVSAHDEEGLIEAIEHRDHPFAVGVQWHPELAPEDEVQGRLFAGLITAAKQHRAERLCAQGAPLS